MRHQIHLAEAKAFTASSIIASSSSFKTKENKRLEVITQDGCVFYAVSNHGEVVLRVGNIEDAVAAYNEL